LFHTFLSPADLGWSQTLVLEIKSQVFYHCTTGAQPSLFGTCSFAGRTFEKELSVKTIFRMTFLRMLCVRMSFVA